MTPERWARVKEVFNAALAQEANNRPAFVADSTAGDEELRSEVERLLAADLVAADFIESPAVTTLLTGRVVSHYEIGPLLGSGGMGRVYAARDMDLGREVALKVATVDSEDARARLRREAQHASRLSHPHICHIYEVGQADGQLFVVMELVGGRSLAEATREQPLSIADATRYGIQIADALAHAHERGVSHRDLKSTNVMVTPRGAKVLDFGLARMLDSYEIDALSQSQRSLTGEGLIAGTLPYMAPELLRGQRGDQRTDIWALGVLLYEMVSGRRPFTGVTGFELSAAILHKDPEMLPPAVPASLATVIRRCLAKDPGDRYQQAADVHLALEALKDATPPPPVRLPRINTRFAVGALLLASLVAIAVIVSYRTGSAIVDSETFSNIRGYSLLDSGEFDRAIEQFKAMANRELNDANVWDSLGEGYLASGKADKSLEAYSRALRINPNFAPSILGRGFALAAQGRYDEALERESSDFSMQAFFLSRVGRYEEAEKVLAQAKRESTQGNDRESALSASLLSSWLLLERRQFAPAFGELGATDAIEAPEAKEKNRPLLVLRDLIAGIVEIRAGRVENARSRLELQRVRYDRDERIESNWVATLEGEIALAQRDYDLALARFKTAEQPAWVTLNRDALAVFGDNPPWRDGRARVEVARGNRAAAIQEYRRLTTVAAGARLSGALEPRHILALARLLEQNADRAGARVEYARFLTLWEDADDDLPEKAEAQQALARLSGS